MEGVTYGLVCARAPGIASDDPSTDLQHMQDGILESTGATLLREGVTTLSGAEGREIVARSATHMIRVWLFVWPDRTLNINVFAEDGRVDTPAIEGFFRSAESARE